MRVVFVWHWIAGRDGVPERYRAADGPFDVTLEEIEELSKTYDVMLHNVRDGIGIYLDEKYKRFSTR